MDTGTDTVPNTPPTAASAGSDLNGMAVLEACKTINQRLEKYKVPQLIVLLFLTSIFCSRQLNQQGAGRIG